METIIFIGSAGAGKSTLTKVFGDFLEKKGFKVFRANFDPACEYLPYEPDLDIRSFYDIDSMMKKEKIGPNLAIIKIYEYISTDNRIKNAIPMEYDYMIVDTAGQLEIFLLRDTGEKFINLFERPIVFILVDAGNVKKEDLIILRLLSVVMSLKLSANVVPIISKADAVKDIKFIEKSSSIDEFINLIGREGDLSDIARDLINILEKYRVPVRPVSVSVKNEESLERLFDIIYEVKCVCGDLT